MNMGFCRGLRSLQEGNERGWRGEGWGGERASVGADRHGEEDEWVSAARGANAAGGGRDVRAGERARG